MKFENFWTLDDLNDEERDDAIEAGVEVGKEYWGDVDSPRADIFSCPVCSRKLLLLRDVNIWYLYT